ncbi:sensor histidine kinase [Paenibacillus turpanensis]|uniref:sensor histidine kinase n=1 Tax=Paenibacillus turpanensis TaxID=2689078 RepID=UPI001408E613|nr:sensor histidine kinase [Paenibacillus turpanensis]
MEAGLLSLRFILLIAPAVGTLFVGSGIFYPEYTLSLLTLIAVAQLRIKSRLPAADAATLAETALIAWLSHTYGGLYPLCIFSTLFSLYVPTSTITSGIRLLLWNLLLPAALFFSVLPALSAVHIALFILYGAFAGLLLYLQQAAGQKRHTEILNDELRRKAYQLEEARKRTAEFARVIEDASQAEERNRISRDLHDDLGHQLIRTKMMAEAALLIMDKQPDKGIELLRGIRDQLTQSMDSLRSTVRRMKPRDEEMKSYSIHRFFQEASIQTGVEFTYEISGTPYPLYPSLEMVLYRNAQESVTNAVRHGGATAVHAHLHYDSKQLMLSVSNNGRIPDPKQTAERGLGLSGMEERAELLGGKLQLDYGERFTVSTWLPNYVNREEQR